MSSWRLDSSERELQGSKPKSAPAPAKKAKKAYDDDDEYDFGAPQQAAKEAPPKQAPLKQSGTERPATPLTGVGAEPVREPDLFNPHKFSLTRVHLKRHSGQALGFNVSFVASGVFKVIKVAEDEAAAKAGIDKDMYLLSADGKRIRSEADFKELDKSNRRAFRMAFVKRRPSPFDPNSFLLPANVQRQSNHQYFYIRLDPTDGTRVGTGIGERNGVVCVTQVVENSAGQKAGVMVGDRLLAIDDTRVENRDSCKTLVQASMGNPFDMILERAPPPPPPPPAPAPARVKVAPPPPPVDPNAGDPSAGVPTTPDDVSIFLDTRAKKALVSIRHSKKKGRAKTRSPRSHSPKSVRLSKQVKSTKLHQKK